VTAGRKPAGTRATIAKTARVAKGKPGRKPGVKAKIAKAPKKLVATKAKKTTAPKEITRAPRGAGARKEAAAALAAAAAPIVKAKRGRKPKVPTLPADAPMEVGMHDSSEMDSI
jgi:septal ring factor EnvC (AmiA/AmiB activator)